MNPAGQRSSLPRFSPTMSCENFHYFADVRRANGGGSLGRYLLNLDLDPVIEWGRFIGLRRWLDPTLAAEASIRVHPHWEAQAGEHRVKALRVTARADRVAPVSADIPIGYFQRSVRRLAASLVSQGRLAARELFDCSILAFPTSGAAAVAPSDQFAIEVVPTPMTLTPGSLSEEREKSVPFGSVDCDLIPVFVPQEILQELLRMTEEANTLETGALLLGRTYLDSRQKELFVKITAQIPAHHVLSESTRITLTAETWAAAAAALELRRSDERLISWFHSHPARYWCHRECSPEARQRCPLGEPFFSIMDCDVHRVGFLDPTCVALLATNTFSGIKLTMYGWDQAMICQRGFYIIKSDAAGLLPASTAASIIGADTHETICNP